MADFNLGGSTTNADLPSILTTEDQIKALPGYKAWLRAQTGFMTLVTSGADQFVQQFQDYSGNGATFTSTESSPNYAKYEAEGLGGFEDAYFDDTSATDTSGYDRYNCAGFTLDFTQSWSAFLVGQADAALMAASGALLGVGSTGAGTKISLSASGTGNMVFGFDGSGAINLPMDTAPFWAIVSFYLDPDNAANSLFSFELNGTRAADAVHAPPTNPGALPSVGSFGNSQGWVGPISEVLFLQQPLHHGSGSDGAARDLLRRHAQYVYGLPA